MSNVISIVKKIKERNRLKQGKRKKARELSKDEVKIKGLVVDFGNFMLKFKSWEEGEISNEKFELWERYQSGCDPRIRVNGDGIYDINGRVYRGRCMKEDYLAEKYRLESLGVKDIKHYKAYDKQGNLVLTDWTIFGRDD